MNKRPFFIPLTVAACLIVFALLRFDNFAKSYAVVFLWLAIAIGCLKLLKDTWKSILSRSFALDYIALLAITTGILTQNYLVAAVIVLMMSGGNALEEYARFRAKRSLTALKNRLPNQVQFVDQNDQLTFAKIDEISIGTTILVRKGEVIPLDGKLLDEKALLDESSLTGEALPVSKMSGELIRSGSLNIGEAVKLITTVASTDSTYQQIIKLVENAEKDKAPFVQLADKLSALFTIVTLFMAGIAFLISGNIEHSLAVLVVATPCPLILATPIALIGGMNAAARNKIIFKQLAGLEVLADVDTLIFDKTGTLTLGKPQLDSLIVMDNSYSKKELLSIAASLERNSLHPFALAIIDAANKAKVKHLLVDSIKEELGVGLSGIVNKQRYYLTSGAKNSDFQVVLKVERKVIAVFHFFDKIKSSTIKTISSLLKLGLHLYLFTGDNISQTKNFVNKLKVPINFKANLSPAEKQLALNSLKINSKIAMIGDGINDAPALASSDVGLAFSHQQHTAASEAADVILLNNDIKAVQISLLIARRTMSIAKQSMYTGMILSLLGMLLAIFGKLTPLLGAVTQEFIDIIVILNALRAANMDIKHKD